MLLTDASKWACSSGVLYFGFLCLYPEHLVHISWGPLIGKVKITQNECWIGTRKRLQGNIACLLFPHFRLTTVFGLCLHWQHYVMKCLVDFWGLCYWGTPPPNLIFFLSLAPSPSLPLPPSLPRSLPLPLSVPTTLGKIWRIRFLCPKEGKVVGKIWEMCRVR